jgi:hypothetical protein
MGNNQKSPIQSTSAKAGAVIGHSASPLKRDNPWRILICTDLGYPGEYPEPLTAAGLTDLMGSHTIRLQGTVQSAAEGQPVFIDYTVKGIDDLQEKKLAAQLITTKPLHFLRELLESLLNGAIDPNTALSRIDQGQCAATPFYEETTRLLSLSSAAPSRQAQGSSPKPDLNRINALLTAIDTSGLDSKPAPSKLSSPVDRLAAAASQRTVSLPREQIHALIERITTSINTHLVEVCSSDFFDRVRTAWIAVRHLAKMIGRRNDIELSVISLSLLEAGVRIPEILDNQATSNATPDLIMLDYPLQMTNAHMDLLSIISTAADQHRAMVLASCSNTDELIPAIQNHETLRTVLEAPRYIPYYRLRKDPASRCILIALPEIKINSSDSLPASVGGAWMILYSLAARLVRETSPFDGSLTLTEIPDGILGSFPLQNAQNYSISAVAEAATAGLTLLTRKTTAENGTLPITIIDPDIAAPLYTLFNYNVLLNRLTRLTARELSRLQGFGDRTAHAVAIQELLISTLSAYRLITAKDEVQVTVDEQQAINVAIDSQKPFSGMDLKIQFGFGG